MNKGRRNELKKLKFISRLKRFVVSHGYFFKRGTLDRIDSPTVQDILNDGGWQWYRTTSCPCNCWMCTYDEYDRNAMKKETERLIREYEENKD
jgi:uncharacterized Fe-S cluster-containing MiaB family protein